MADNTAGTNRDAYIPDCILTPSGDLAWKSRDTAQALAFEVGMKRPDDGRAMLYINGRAA